MTPSIVVLTDFFAGTNRALSYAAGLAVPLKASLLLLHVRHDELLAPEEFASRHTTAGAFRPVHERGYRSVGGWNAHELRGHQLGLIDRRARHDDRVGLAAA